MTTDRWKYAVSGHWDVVNDWSAGVPGPADDALITAPTPIAVSYGSGTATVNSLTMDTGHAGTFYVTGGQLTVTNELNIYGSLFVNGATVDAGRWSRVTGGLTLGAKGTLDFGSRTLTLAGTSVLAGSLTAGLLDVELQNNTDSVTLVPGAQMNVGVIELGDGEVRLGGKFTYAGRWIQNGGDVLLNGKALVLTGIISASGGQATGPGAIALAGSTTMGNYSLTGGVTMTNAAQMAISGPVYLLDSASGSPSLVNGPYGAITLIGSTDEISGDAGTSFTNEGKIVATGNGGFIDTAFVNTGNVFVDQGQMTFVGGVTGDGNFTIGAGSGLDFNSEVGAGSAVTMRGASQLEVTGLTASGANGFDGTIAGFAAGNAIEVQDFLASGSSLSFNAGTDQLTLTNAGGASAVLQFAGSYSSSDFQLTSTSYGAAVITHS